MREMVRQTMIAEGMSTNTTVVIAGLTNAYSSYVTTVEEYGVGYYSYLKVSNYSCSCVWSLGTKVRRRFHHLWPEHLGGLLARV